MTKAQKLAELDAKFNSPQNEASGALKLDAYLARRAAIAAEPEAMAAPTPAPAKPQNEDQRVVTHGFLRKGFEAFGEGFAKAILEAIAEVTAAADARAARFRVDLDTANSRLALALVQVEALNAHNSILLERSVVLHDRVKKLEEQLK